MDTKKSTASGRNTGTSERVQTELGQVRKGRRGEEVPTKSGDQGQETDQEFVKGRQK